MTAPTTTGGSSVRRRIADARATIVGTKGLRARVAKHSATLSTLRTRLDDQKQRIAPPGPAAEGARGAREGPRTAPPRSTCARASAATPTSGRSRCAWPTSSSPSPTPHRVPRRPAPDDDQLAAGRTLLDEVRTEHARIRARMQVVSAYEERLRRVEESVTELFDGDRRHLV